MSSLDGCGFYEDSRALLNTLDFVMPPAGKGPWNDGPLHPRVPGAPPLGTPCRHARRSCGRQLPCGAGRLRVICRRERQYAHGSRRHGGARVPVPQASCTAFPAGQLPSAKAPSGDLPGGMRCARCSRRLGDARVPLPAPSLRRMCRRQGTASHASTRGTSPLNIRGGALCPAVLCEAERRGEVGGCMKRTVTPSAPQAGGSGR